MAVRILSLLAGLLLAAHAARGHGRIQTHVTADVREESAKVVINAAWIDLALAAGMAWEDFADLPEEVREDVLRTGMRTFADRFFLLDETGERLAAKPPEMELPETGGPLPTPGPEQRQGRVTLVFPFAGPPGELLFWQRFGSAKPNELYPDDAHHSLLDRHDFSEEALPAIPIQSILTIRQNGEMAMLPAEFGPGFPVRFSISWTDDFVPLAHRESLRSAAARADNRPPNGRLTVEDNAVVWRVVAPLDILDRTLGERWSRAEGWEALREILMGHISLTVDGQTVDPAEVNLGAHPMTVMSLLHRRPLDPASTRPGMAVLELTHVPGHPPAEVEAGWTLFGEGFAALHADVFAGGEPTGFSVLRGNRARARFTSSP